MSSSKAPVRSPSPTGSVRSAAPPTSINASAFGEKKDGLKVELFYGDRAKLGMFLVQLQAVFALRPNDYNSHPARVLYAAMHMRGSAFHWIEPLMKDYLTYSQDQWEDETKRVFGKYVAQYYALFQRLKSKLDWENHAFASVFYQGLKDNVKDEMGMDRPKQLKDLVARAISIDNWLFERRLEKKGSGRPHFGGTFYAKKSHQSYGDPMDLDAMERGRSSRPNKGKFQRKGPSKKEQERRRKENLCYSCGKSGHMARECGNRPRELHMMEKVTAGIEAKKADTSMKKELAQLEELEKEAQVQFTELRGAFRQMSQGCDRMMAIVERASIAEKAQKGPRQVQEEGATSGEVPYPQETGAAPVTAKDDLTKFEEDLERQQKENLDHAMTSWAFCFDDHCPIHLSEKEGSGWFPHGKKNKRRQQRQQLLDALEEDEQAKSLSVMERVYPWEQYEVEMLGMNVAVIRTNYWVDTPCDGSCKNTQEGQCKTLHRKFSPHGDPESRSELILLTKCEAWCEHSASHTHDIVGQESYDFTFTTEEEDADDEWEVQVPLYTVKEVYKSTAVISTRYWKAEKFIHGMPCTSPHLLCFAPDEQPRERRDVTLWRCYQCGEGVSPHTHCMWKNGSRRIYDFPYAKEATNLTREMSMRYTVIRYDEEFIAISTRFWSGHGTRPFFQPFKDPEIHPAVLSLTLCRNKNCNDKENMHSHGVRGVRTWVWDTQHLTSEVDEEPPQYHDEEWNDEDLYFPEERTLMMMEPQVVQEEETELSKFVIVAATRSTQTMITQYWKVQPCQNPWCTIERQHSHIVFDPNIEPKEYVRRIKLHLCQDWECEEAPELHIHQADGEAASCEIPEVIAQRIYGTTHPKMHNIASTEAKNE